MEQAKQKETARREMHFCVNLIIRKLYLDAHLSIV